MKSFFTRLGTIFFILPLFFCAVILSNVEIFVIFSILLYKVIIYEWFLLNNFRSLCNLFFYCLLNALFTFLLFCFPNFHKLIYFFSIVFWNIVILHTFCFPRYKTLWKHFLYKNIFPYKKQLLLGKAALFFADRYKIPTFPYNCLQK